MVAKMTMKGVKAGQNVEQRSTVEAEQSMKAVEAVAGSARQIIEVSASEMDILRRELPELLKKVREYDPSAEKQIGQLTKAESAAGNNDSAGVVDSLQGVGRWVAELATKAGTTVVAKLIERQMGMGGG